MTCKLCHVSCITCYGTNSNNCLTCDNYLTVNNGTCYSVCQPKYGLTTNPYSCIWCNLKCSVCYDKFDNCTACTTSGTWESFLYFNSTLGYKTCKNVTCPVGMYPNTTDHVCYGCNSACVNCTVNSTYCYACQSGNIWFNYVCNSTCPDGYFINGTNCSACNSKCITCTTSDVICTSCTLNGSNTAYLFASNNTCVTSCPVKYFKDNNDGLGPNLCTQCDLSCSVCTSLIVCTACSANYYFLNNSCYLVCPATYFGYNLTWKCVS